MKSMDLFSIWPLGPNISSPYLRQMHFPEFLKVLF